MELKPGDVLFSKSDHAHRLRVVTADIEAVNLLSLEYGDSTTAPRWYVEKYFCLELGSALEDDSDDSQAG